MLNCSKSEHGSYFFIALFNTRQFLYKKLMKNDDQADERLDESVRPEVFAVLKVIKYILR